MSKSTYEAGQRLDRYTLLRPLGKGAAGEVWLATDEGEHGFKKRVALKLLAGPATEERVEMLMREARIAALLRHPNIVDVYGVGRVPGAAFIVMEFVEGFSLAAIWKDLEQRGKRLPKSVVLDAAVAIGEALHHAWTAPGLESEKLRLIHRDLKPANVLLSDRGLIQIADFGVAKVVGELDRTRVGQIKGTPSYLSPEQWAGSRDFGPQVDMYALGVMLWEMGTGRRFYGSVSAMKIPEIIASRSAEDEAEALAEHFPEIQPVVARLLGRTPESRPKSWIEVADTLRVVRRSVASGGDILAFLRLMRTVGASASIESSLVAAPPLVGLPKDWSDLLEGAEDYAQAVGSSAPVAVALGPKAEPEPVLLPDQTGEARDEAARKKRKKKAQDQGAQLALAAAIGAGGAVLLFTALRVMGVL